MEKSIKRQSIEVGLSTLIISSRREEVPSLRKAPKGLDIEHHIPGRTRLRLHKKHAKSVHIEHMHKQLKELPGVKEVHFNKRTGSFLVHHEEHPEMFGVLAEASGALATQLFDLVIEAEEIELAGLFLVGGFLVTRLLDSVTERVKPAKKPGLAHHTEGRTRLKVHHHERDGERLKRLKEKIEEVEGVTAAHVNHRTGSVTIHHDSTHETLSEVGDIVKEFSSELFESIVLKGESPVSAGMHVFAHAIVGTSGSNEKQQSLATVAGMAAIFLLLPRLPAV